jgi:hypothetical protein
MSVSMTAAVDRPVSRPRLRHGFFAAALLAVAGLRLADGDLVWAAVLATAGAVEVGLALAARRTAPGSPASPTARPGAPLPAASVVERSLLSHRRNGRLWLGALGASTVAAAALLMSAPTIAAVLGVLALVSLRQVRRGRRSVATLQRLTCSEDPATEDRA